MSANQDTYDNPAWGRPATGAPWGQQGGGGFPGGAREFLNGLPRPVAIAMTVLAFILWWPVGLAVLFYLLGTGRLGARWRRNRMPGWSDNARGNGWSAWACGGRPETSGNHAFDEYKMQTLKRLEEEQQEFTTFLDRLRFAKDKAEFDQFMAERRGRPPAPPTDGEQAAA